MQEFARNANETEKDQASSISQPDSEQLPRTEAHDKESRPEEEKREELEQRRRNLARLRLDAQRRFPST